MPVTRMHIEKNWKANHGKEEHGRPPRPAA